VVAWRERELRKAKGLSAAARAARRERVTDDADMLIMLSEGCSGMAEMQGRIADLFDDSRAGDLPTIVCSSVHRAKGLEWDRVFILRDTLYPGNRRSTEEENIEYVAVTRAKSTLCWVTK
jgi:superfamily I DNA/RNA helicase